MEMCNDFRNNLPKYIKLYLLISDPLAIAGFLVLFCSSWKTNQYQSTCVSINFIYFTSCERRKRRII